MLWQDYKKLYASALRAYSPKFKKELQAQVDAFCATQSYASINGNGLKKTITDLHATYGTKMAKMANKDVKRASKSFVAIEYKGTYDELWQNVITMYLNVNGLDKLVNEISDTTKEQIKRYISRGLAEGQSMNEIIRNLQSAGITNYRAELIARTETGKAANYGSMIGAVSTGLVTYKEWISAKDNRTRRIPRDQFDHLAMDGVSIPMDEKFQVPSKLKGFELMDHPCDPKASAGDVCNCRCTLGYEAQRDAAGQLQTYYSNPPSGNIKIIWDLLQKALTNEVYASLVQALG